MYSIFLLDIELFVCHKLLIIYRFISLYDVSHVRMTIDLLPSKPKMAAILDVFFNETLKVINSFRNEFSIKNHMKMR